MADDLDEWLDHTAHVTRQEFHREITRLEKLMEASQAQNQASIDAETALIEAIGSKLDTVRTEIDALKAAQATGQALNFANLDAAVAAVGTKADASVADGAPAAPPAPSPPPTPAPASEPAPAPAAPPEPAPAPVIPAATAKSVYVYDGDPASVDQATWPQATVETADPSPRSLYTFAGDTLPGDTHGDGQGGLWHLYTGPTQPAASSAPPVAEPAPPVAPAPAAVVPPPGG